jgi:4'-phosphopantetheinyl transferase
MSDMMYVGHTIAMSLAASRIPAQEVHISFLDPGIGGLDAPQWSRLLGWLQPDERARFDRFRHLDGRASFLIGRGLARQVLSDATDVPAAEWRFREGPRGRPEIAAPETTLRFNLAHSGGVVACVIGDGVDVGVDVEHLDRPALAYDVARRCCSDEELADIHDEPEEHRQRRFLIYWTLKEAYLKALGLGISVHLPDVSFSLATGEPRLNLRGSLADDQRRWVFGLTQPTPRHILAAAAGVRDEDTVSLRFQRFRASRFTDG